MMLLHLCQDGTGHLKVLLNIRGSALIVDTARACLIRGGGRHRVGAEHNADAPISRSGGIVSMPCSHLLLHLFQPVLQAVGEGLHKPGGVEELADLIDAHLTVKPQFLKRHPVVFTVLAAAGVAGVGAGGEHQNIAVPFLIRLLQHVTDVGVPVAVRPHDGDARAAFGQGLFQGGQQSTVLLVNGRDTAVSTVVGGDLFKTLIGNPAARRDITQEGNHIVLPLGAAER